MKRTNVLVCGAVLLATLIGSGGVHAAEQQTPSPNNAKTTLTADLTTPDLKTPNPPTDPDNPTITENEPVDVKGEGGNLGIAYYPKAFAFSGKLGDDTLTLEDSGKNTSTTNTPYNVGVKDNTRQFNAWTLTAQLKWDGGELPGSTLTIKNPNDGKVRKNDNNGTSNFRASDLVSQSEVIGTDPEIIIGSEEKTIMTKNTNTVCIGTYDYSLGNVGTLKLTIPSATYLSAKQYGGHVNWNLKMTPDVAQDSAG
ncbi:WxL domain-containing protein [Enterococcus faecium]|uniref:WxL domain-containing protein n=1 Tax=Enterococcus faecium TaxID=1352 RepID=A0A9X3XXR3_ENTFC|nr:WxL domain-containing protein [Enterococcus faecium]MDC4249090.1 WxL domain-containing protein [Enterococcus faecium]